MIDIPNSGKQLPAFLVDEDGAVTTDFVVITAAIVGLAIAVLSNITVEARGVADDISETVAAVPVDGS